MLLEIFEGNTAVVQITFYSAVSPSCLATCMGHDTPHHTET